MERRRFILLSLTAAGVITACQPASKPGMLGSLCDEKTLHAIGRAYLEQFPGEKNKHILNRFVEGGRVQDDFINGNIVVVDGWVLSITEARQCALLTL